MTANENILAIRIGSYGRFVLHSYEHISELGVRFIEREIPQDSGETEMLKDILEEFSLSISSFQVKFEPMDLSKLKQQAESYISICKEFGTKVLFTSLKAPEKPKKRDNFFEHMRVLGDAVLDAGIRVCLETHPNLVTNGHVGLETMKAINHECIRINFDTANMYYYNKDIDALQELELIADYVGSVHLKDTNGQYKTWHFPALGDGIVDFPAIIKRLGSAGFHGPYTIEIEGIKGESLDLDGVKARIKKSVEYITQFL
ncbi:MAG: sugar phosphate isomerase/epimerase family protein [Promethearchaeota archaeon]